MPQKQLNARLLLAALAISALLFGGGLATGFAVSRERFSSVEQEVKDVLREVENFQLQFLFFDVLGEKATCPLLSDTLASINRKSFTLGQKLTIYGSDTEIKDEGEYNALKNEYSRLLVSYWLLANKLQKACDSSAHTIVYFYEKTCDRCADQAFVLTYLKQQDPDKLLVFALDGSVDEASVATLKEYYRVTSYPTLIIDGIAYPGFRPAEELRQLLAPA